MTRTDKGKPVLAVLHPGAMGAAVGACLVGAGYEVRWWRAGRSAATTARAEAAGMGGHDTLEAVLVGVDVVFSICPPHAALDVARRLAGFTGTVVDANAVSPATAELIARTVVRGGARYVDGGLVGPPPTTPGTTRLYLAGDDGAVAALFAATPLEAVALDAPAPAASALKMTYAAWTKTTAALLVSIRRTAAALGVEDALVDEWARSQPDLPAAWERARRSAAGKGWRWAFELAEVGRTFAAVGEPEGFGAAASQVFAGDEHAARPLDQRALDPVSLGMQPHPEGGWFRETYRSTHTVDTTAGPRASATGISFLLEAGQASAWHRVRHDELWLWQGGGPCRLTLGGVGSTPAPAEVVELTTGDQYLVPGGVWQTAEPVQDATLVACIVSPGFDFDDFQLA